MRREGLVLAVLLGAGTVGAAAPLSRKQVAASGYVTGLQCFQAWQNCEGATPLAPNAFANALGLPAPTATGTAWAWDTAGRGWRVQHQIFQGEWAVRLTPLGRRLSAAELQVYPQPKEERTWNPVPPHMTGGSTPSNPAPARGTAPAPVAEGITPRGMLAPTAAAPLPSASPSRGGAGTSSPAAGRSGSGSGTGSGTPGGGGTGGSAAVTRAGGGGSAAARNAGRPPACTVVVDVRGLGPFQRDMTSYLYNEGGTQLWPDASMVRGVSSRLMQENNLHTYITSERQIGQFQNVTRVKALRLQASRVTPNTRTNTDAVLGPTSTRAFRAAGQACRVVYLMDA